MTKHETNLPIRDELRVLWRSSRAPLARAALAVGKFLLWLLAVEVVVWIVTLPLLLLGAPNWAAALVAGVLALLLTLVVLGVRTQRDERARRAAYEAETAMDALERQQARVATLAGAQADAEDWVAWRRLHGTI